MFTKENAESYFVYSKTVGIVLLAMGIAATITAAALYIWGKTPTNKGVAIGLIIIAISQLAFGYKLYSESDKERKAVVYQMSLDPDAIRHKALPNAEKMSKLCSYATYTFIGISLFALFLIIKFRNDALLDETAFQPQLLKGIGIGLLIQAVLCLMGNGAFDIQTKRYIKGLNQFLEQPQKMV